MARIIRRRTAEGRLEVALSRAPVVVLTGPRQAGKTTLARRVVGPRGRWFDAEDPLDAAQLADPMLALEGARGLVAIDEAQRLPDLFPVLRVLVDRHQPGEPAPTQFLVLGSASPDLVGLASESLAGRVELVDLGGLTVADVGSGRADRLWTRGGLPPAFTAGSESDSRSWRDQYIATFLERDLAQLGSRVPATTMRRAWTMLAHYHGQSWNGAELARALGVSEGAARRYLDALTDALVVRQLAPWFANIGKRQRKAPKVYVRDSGLLHRLLGIDDAEALHRHPKVGASWEGFVIEQLSAALSPRPVWYWRTQDGAELDLYVELGGGPVGFEIKRASVPGRNRSMLSALADLELRALVLVYPGRKRVRLGERIEAVPAAELLPAASADDVEAILG